VSYIAFLLLIHVLVGIEAYKAYVKLEGKRPLGKHRCRWEDSTGMNLRKI
jgi:hypothetical protein